MQQRVYLAPEARELGIVAPSVGVISGIHVFEEYPAEYQKRLDEILRGVVPRPDYVEGYREVFRKMGHDGVVPAGERLMASFLGNGLKKINNVVDAYNAIALKYVAGIGLHDASCIDTDVKIGRARGGEAILPLFQSKQRKVPPGDLVYSCNNRLIAWLGKRDVDSDDFKVTDNTTSVLTVVLGNANTPAAMTRAIVQEIFALLSLTCPAATLEFREICH